MFRTCALLTIKYELWYNMKNINKFFFKRCLGKLVKDSSKVIKGLSTNEKLSL